MFFDVNQPFLSRRLLLPLTPLYRLALAFGDLRLRSGLEPVRRLRFPVVSIGNLSTGGSGKTPLTIALAKALASRGLRVDVLSRGYGRKSKLAARVCPGGTAEDFGDEPLLIAREARVPVFVAPQRYDAGLLAEADAQQTDGDNYKLGAPSLRVLGARVGNLKSQQPFVQEENRSDVVHLLDDGFQHRQLYRDVDILLLNRNDWHDSLLPAGNLREPLRTVRRAGVIAIPADEPDLEAELRKCGWQGPLWRLRRTMEILAVDGPVAAFCGIAHPQQFFQGLEASGLRLAASLAFPDHFRYTASILEDILAEARAAGAKALVTTEKDLVRVGKVACLFPESLPLKAARLTVEIEDEDAAIDWLVDRLGISLPA